MKLVSDFKCKSLGLILQTVENDMNTLQKALINNNIQGKIREEEGKTFSRQRKVVYLLTENSGKRY